MGDNILQIDLSSQTNKTITNFFNKLFEYIYLLADIKLVEHKSKLYFETSNQWGGGKPEDLTCEQISRLAYNSDIVLDDCDDSESECEDCDDSESEWEDCDDNESELEDYNLDPKDFKYIYSWDSNAFKHFLERNEDYQNEYIIDVIRSIHKFIKKNFDLTVPDVHIILSKPLILNNTSGFNTDRRGSDHIPLDLPWSSHVHLDSTVKLNELIDTAFLIKSHKFDKWYELYLEIKSGPKSKDFIELNVEYDHGS